MKTRIRRFLRRFLGLDELTNDLRAAGAQLAELETRLSALQEVGCPHADALDKALKEIQFEWDKWYNKFRSLHANMVKNGTRAEPTEETGPPPMNPAARALLNQGRW